MELPASSPQTPRLGAEPEGAAFVVRNARIYVGSDGQAPRFADAMVVADGRIRACGASAEMEREATPRTEVVDAGGRTVIPGLIDSHLHLVRAGATWNQEITWFEVGSLERALELLRQAAATQAPGTWIRVVGGWHPGQFAERRGPTSSELSVMVPDHPVYVQLLYEEAVLNAAGLHAAGIVPGVEDPPRGTFERDDAGQPTGTVRGVGAFQHCLGQMPPPSADEAVDGTRALMASLNRYGLTGGTDAGGLGMAPESYDALFALWRSGGMTLRTRLYVGPFTPGRERAEVTGWLRHARPGFGDGWLRHVGLGEIAVFGCHDLEGLAPFTLDDASLQGLEAVLRDAAARSWPVHLHSVLDTTTSAILDVWERVAADHAIGGMRWSLAHVEPVSRRNLDRIAALRAGIAVQDRMVYRATDSAAVWGEDAVRTAPPLRSILARGIPLGAGTDSTRVASPNPWVALWWLTTGRTLDDGPERSRDERLSRVEALDAYTTGSAWFSFEERQRGRVRPGMAADFAVLSDDYFDVADDDIPTLRSLLTVVDGRAVHADAPFAGLT